MNHKLTSGLCLSYTLVHPLEKAVDRATVGILEGYSSVSEFASDVAGLPT